MITGLIRKLALLLALLSVTPLTFATPILSNDGSTLSGLDVNGVAYDIEFLDGVVSDIFPAAQVLAPGWYDLAGSVSAALYTALAAMGLNDNEAIRGCEDNPGIPGYVGPNICIIVTPDKLDTPDTWGADNVVVVNENGTFIAPPPYGAGIGGDADTSATGFLTLARFSPAGAPVPAPGSLLLALSGLLLVALRRRPR